jgi:hypothetical protein
MLDTTKPWRLNGGLILINDRKIARLSEWLIVR